MELRLKYPEYKILGLTILGLRRQRQLTECKNLVRDVNLHNLILYRVVPLSMFICKMFDLRENFVLDGVINWLLLVGKIGFYFEKNVYFGLVKGILG